MSAEFKTNQDLYIEVIDLIESWHKRDILVPEAAHAGLTAFIQLTMDTAPCHHALLQMISSAMQTAVELSTSGHDHDDEEDEDEE